MEEEDPLVAQCRQRVGHLVGGKWRLDALIGVGGMAAVYMATHRNGNMAALKILHEDVARNSEVRERFLREAYIANKVNHPGTVRVLDDDKDDDGTPYIVMELLRGESIDSRATKAGGKLSAAETLEILDQTLAVLEAAHAQTIVHRDLKPENLFWTDQGLVKVLDFGIARLREENSKKTQTGMVMGTPAFMAPEQAMGRWSDVDPRTDLWAMGATAFTLLTGVAVHEAETAGEMLVAAATRPARSLARVLSTAPLPLIALIDKALSYERDNRFSDAAAFRKELAKIRGGASNATIIRPMLQNSVPPPASKSLRPAAPSSLEQQAPPPPEKQRIHSYDPSLSTDDDIARLQKFFAALGIALTSTRQYGQEHPEARRRFDEAYRELNTALEGCEVALSWNMTPYSFSARDQPIWEPEAPWNRIPYNFFADGVRMMGLSPGLSELEFRTWLKLLLLDPLTELSPDDDLVTMLWDAGFEHLFFQAVDTFAEGNQDQRASYEAERNNVLDEALKDHRIGLAESMADEEPSILGGTSANRSMRPGRATGKKTNTALEKSRELFKVLARGETADAEASARVANFNILEESPDEVEAARAIEVDGTAIALLSSRMELDVSGTSERFVIAAAEAFVASAKMQRSAAVSAPLRRAVDGLSNGSPVKALEMILELRDALTIEGDEAETASLRDLITSEVLSTQTLLEILRGSNKVKDEIKPEYLKNLGRVLNCIQTQHFDAALEFLPEASGGPIEGLLIEFVTRNGKGTESKLGAIFPKLGLDLALSMVRLLASFETASAKEAIGMAVESPHALVRIEALGVVEGPSGPRLRAEMRRLLEDPNPEVRLTTLRAMESHEIAIAGPFLVLRIQEPTFGKLSIEERKQSLQALCKLRAKRGEEVCMALLSKSSLLRSRASEETRELAAQFLGEVASSDPAFFLLDSIANSSMFKNSKRVRDAALAALARLKARAAEIERRRTERKTIAGAKPDPKRKPVQTGEVRTGPTQSVTREKPANTNAGAFPTPSMPVRREGPVITTVMKNSLPAGPNVPKNSVAAPTASKNPAPAQPSAAAAPPKNSLPSGPREKVTLPGGRDKARGQQQ